MSEITKLEEENDRLVDTIRRLEREKYSCRDREGKLKVGTAIRTNKKGVDGIIGAVGSLEKSYTGRQPYIVCFPVQLRDKQVQIHNYWADETQFVVVDEL